MATSAPGRIAGMASSTTITRFSVEVVSTTMAPSAGLNEAEPDDAEPGEDGIVHAQPTWIAASANALMSMPTT